MGSSDAQHVCVKEDRHDCAVIMMSNRDRDRDGPELKLELESAFKLSWQAATGSSCAG